ncbi:aspartate-semialdehyde dehydrogenase [Pseudomonas sp. UL073]|uniref:Aspartate-semialdehyde dehydrogenase n=1 Tax=Zestomonas insulae TaxID=2809017 RepID=A0ABS2ICN1_9GAMM|nr:aspartate-semialdehyde dehydrogenase [Pseudomonas insulae]MBM7060871.1 aspartate-semialdehyde dehydrogenase [Pseudomonas insulae]
MSKLFNVAVIGATGTVGETLVQLLEEREFPLLNLHLLASSESVGQSLPFRGKNVRVRDIDAFDFSQVQLAFFAAAEAVTLSYAPRAQAAGCSVIDLSGALPADQAPRVVPEVNAEVLASLAVPVQVACPNATATALAVVLAPLRSLLTVRRLSVTACLAVSGAGREGVAELARQTTELLNMRPLEPRFFDRQIAFNLLARTEPIQGTGHTRSELQIAADIRHVLADDALKVSATCLQAPVFFGDSLSVTLELVSAVDLLAVQAALEAAPGVELVDSDDYPTAVGDAVGQDAVYVGRLRSGLTDDAELNLWIASDNVRKGSALNAVQLGELLIKHYL